MDIMEPGAIGELVGGVAVIATLIYLAIQVRESNAIELAETHRSFVRDWNQAALQPLRDANAANILRRSNRDFERLSEDEKVQVFGHNGQLFSFLSSSIYCTKRAERKRRSPNKSRRSFSPFSECRARRNGSIKQRAPSSPKYVVGGGQDPMERPTHFAAV